MSKNLLKRISDSFSDNRKSKIENPKWRGLSVIAFVLVVAGPVAQAQQPAKVPRIGFLGSTTASAFASRVEALRAGLRDLGYVEGKNIVIEWRWAEGKVDRLSDLAADLVRLKVDVIVTSDGIAIRAAKGATATIPIVMTQSIDPVDLGFVASLAKPGGNITGLSFMAPETSGKGLELLKEAFPKISRVAVLAPATSSTSSPTDGWFQAMEAAAQALGVKLQILTPADADGIDSAFSAMTRERAGALVVRPNPIFLQNRTRIVMLAAKNRLPAMYTSQDYVEAGGLMSYGANNADLWRRSATYVDKILKGAKPADLPVEQPMKFEFVINLQTAKQIGLTIPQSVLFRADKVIK